MIDQRIIAAVRDVKNLSKEGIIFKDITTILKDQELCSGIVDAFKRN
jgi:adenine phosphoribosyltransferase